MAPAACLKLADFPDSLLTFPSAIRREAAGTRQADATSLTKRPLALKAALRTAGVIDVVVMLPPEGGPGGMLVSPTRTVMSRGCNPSSSATISAITVLMPPPMSWTAESASTEPSWWMRTSQPESMLLMRYQTACATPTPRFTGPGSLFGLRRFCAHPNFSAPMRRSSRRSGLRSFLSMNSRTSMPTFSASASMVCSSPNTPCGWPGARIAAPGPAFVKTSYSSTRRLGQSYMFCAGPALPAPVPTPAVP